MGRKYTLLKSVQAGNQHEFILQQEHKRESTPDFKQKCTFFIDNDIVNDINSNLLFDGDGKCPNIDVIAQLEKAKKHI